MGQSCTPDYIETGDLYETEESPTGPESLPQHNLFSKKLHSSPPLNSYGQTKEPPLDVHLSPQEEEEAPLNPNIPTCIAPAPVQRPLACYLDSQEA